MSEPTQSFESHAKFVAGYHYVATGLLMLPALYFGYRALFAFSADRLVLFLFAVGVVVAAFYARVFPLGVQDRVIRIEERLRLEQLLPPDLQSRIPEFTTNQLVGLRFASDEELPDLARRVLGEKITDRTAIKRAVRAWRPDHQRI